MKVNQNMSICGLSLFFLIDFIGAKPVSELQVSSLLYVSNVVMSDVILFSQPDMTTDMKMQNKAYANEHLAAM